MVLSDLRRLAVDMDCTIRKISFALGNSEEHEIPGLYGIDTRELTKIIRENGTMQARIIHDNIAKIIEKPYLNLVKEVTRKGKKIQLFVEGSCLWRFVLL